MSEKKVVIGRVEYDNYGNGGFSEWWTLDGSRSNEWLKEFQGKNVRITIETADEQQPACPLMGNHGCCVLNGSTCSIADYNHCKWHRDIENRILENYVPKKYNDIFITHTGEGGVICHRCAAVTRIGPESRDMLLNALKEQEDNE